MFSEIHRILKQSGRYICVTLAQQHILSELLSYFSELWFIRVHRIEICSKQDGNHREEGLGGKLPVFVFVFTKMKSKCK